MRGEVVDAELFRMECRGERKSKFLSPIADQAPVARRIAERTTPGEWKPDFPATKKIPLAFAEYRD